MFSVLRQANVFMQERVGYANKRQVTLKKWYFANDAEREQLSELMLPGSYMPWQLGSSSYHMQNRVQIDGDRCFHEAGHALACAYEDREHRFADVELQLNFLLQFRVPENGYGKKAAAHEARAHAFAILLADAIDPDNKLSRVLVERRNIDMMAGHCQQIASGSDFDSDDPDHIEAARIINNILDTYTPAQVLQDWKDLCKRLAKIQAQEDDAFLSKYKELAND